MPSSARPASQSNPLRRRLASLRRQLLLVIIVRGVSLLLALVLGVAVVGGLLDWAYHLPALVRAVLLVATLCGGGYVGWWFLLRSLSVRRDDLALALRIEDQYPGLEDALASAVQFMDEKRAPSESPVLRREAVRRALGKAEGFDFTKAIDTGGLYLAVRSFDGIGAVALALLVLFPAQVATALARLANPFGTLAWPTQTRLELDAPRLRVGRGEPFEIRGRVFGVLPEQASVVFRFDGYPPIEHRCDVIADEEGASGRLATRLEPARVQRNFRFLVRANDAVSEEFRVEVLPPPVLVPLGGLPSPQVTLHHPAYTGLPSPERLSPGSGSVEAVVGTGVSLRAAADRPLRRARVEFQPEVRVAPLMTFLAPLGTSHLASTLALWAGGREVWAPVPAVLDDNRAAFTVRFLPRATGTYALHFEDESGLRNSRTFDLRLQPDPAPTVNLDRPSPSRDVLAVLPDAVLTLHVLAEDPIFGLRSVFLEYRTLRNDWPRRLSLYHYASAARDFVAPAAGPGILAAAPRLHFRPARMDFNRPLLLALLKHPDGTALKEGDLLILQAGADDFDDVAVDKQPGRSHEVEIRIIGRTTLEKLLNQEQAKIQQDILRLREKQREAREKVAEVEKRLRKGDKLSAEDLNNLLQAEQAQAQVREGIGSPKEGLRKEVNRLLETLRQNGMEKSGTRDVMDNVARELERIAGSELEQIEPRLTNARKQAELLEEKPREERRKRLEEQARETEKQARDAEQAANKQEEAAAAKEKQADAKNAGDPEKVRLANEAKRQRQQAAENRTKAAELREQAQRERRDADAAPDQNQPRQQLAEANQQQQEVERTLDRLLTDLGPWLSTREIKGEAKHILEDQGKLQKEVDKLQEENKGLLGKDPNKLTPQEKADLNALKDAQQRLEERTRQLLDRMNRVANERADKDPEAAKELRDAVQQGTKGNVAGQMKSARENLEKNQLGAARKDQQGSIDELKKLVKTLEDKREAELDRLARKQREMEKELDKLIQEQEQLQKKIKEANKLADPKEREEALKRLAREQKELEKKTQDVLARLSRMQAGRASQALGKAGKEMEQASQQLSRGEDAEQQQEEILDRLDDAAHELEQQREHTEDELAREQLARIADTLKALKERQERLTGETARLQQKVLENKNWTRTLAAENVGHANNQKGLAGETADVAKKELTGAPVFARILKRSAEAMEDAADKITEAPRQRDRQSALEEDALPRQKEALRRIDQLLAALKEEQQGGGPRAGGGGGGGSGGGGGGSGAGDGIPELAQLKLLRAMQQDVNKRTDEFTKLHPDAAQWTDKDKAALQAIRRDQQEVADLIEEMNRPGGDPGEPEGDKP